MVGLRLISLGLAAVICITLVWMAATQKFSAIADLFDDPDAVKVEIEEDKKPPPPPPPNRPPPPPPPEQRVPPPNLDAPPTPTPIPVAVDPPPSPPTPSVLTGVTWLEQPDARDYARYYPERAQERDVEGRATVECLVDPGGRLSCTITSEDPPGYGFGEATLRVSRHFRVAAATRDGVATSGGRIRRTVRWQLPD